MTLSYETDDTVHTGRIDTMLHPCNHMRWIQMSGMTKIYESARCVITAATRQLRIRIG